MMQKYYHIHGALNQVNHEHGYVIQQLVTLETLVQIKISG